MNIPKGTEEQLQKVIVQNSYPEFDGKIGIIARWLFSDWYVINVDGEEILLDYSRKEFKVIKKEN